MILITGGVFQGKEAYVRKKYRPEETVDAGEAGEKQLWKSDCVLNYHKRIRRQIEKGEDALAAAQALISHNPRVIITIDEVGSGVVPLNRTDSIYREQTGRVAAFFAKEAEAVYRLVCGIPQRLK